jgi:hypothetical protein
MASARTFPILGMILYLLAIFAPYGYAGEGDTTWQINTPVDEILKANPLPAGEKSQMIKLAEDDSVSVYLVRMAPGADCPCFACKARQRGRCERNNVASVLEAKMLKHHSLLIQRPQPDHGWESSPDRLWSYTIVAG